MFLTVDYGGPFTGFVMKETRGVKENHVFHCKDLHIESETQSYRLCVVEEPQNVTNFVISKVIF